MSGQLRWSALAAIVFGLALWLEFQPVFAGGASRGVPSVVRPGGWEHTTRDDLRFVAWGVTRNAHALLHEPWALFDAQQCYPQEASLALGHPMIAEGLIAAPIRLVVGDPVLTYNLTVLAVVLLSAFATHWVVRGWTGDAMAGIAAGLLFAFHPVVLGRIFHLCIYDVAWTVLALGFAQRFFEGGRVRDAVAVAACTVLQMGTSFYAAAGALLFGLPFAVWLPLRYGVRQLRPLPVLVLVLGVALGAVALAAPYLGQVATTERGFQGFAAWSEFLPGGARFPGWLPLLLALAAFLPGRLRRGPGVPGPNPRVVLLAAFVVVVSVASSPTLSSLLPGFRTVRHPALIAGHAQLAIAMLCGLGVASIARSVPDRFSTLVGAAGVGLAALCVFVPALSNPHPLFEREVAEIRPPEEAIELFRELEERGNRGPVVEIHPQLRASTSVLLSSFHLRPTSACVTAHIPAAVHQVQQLKRRLPDRAAARELAQLGFTTLVLHHPPDAGLEGRKAALLRAAQRPSQGLKLLYEGESVSAFELLD